MPAQKRRGIFVGDRRLPRNFIHKARRWHVRPSRFVLVVSIGPQSVRLFEKDRIQPRDALSPQYTFRRQFLASTSAWGIGQRENSNQTPLGMHRIARKIGGGWPIGAVFRHRRMIGFTWQGLPQAAIVHRILWLEGLEPGFNRGGQVDTFRRYIYIHGFGDETTLGRPCSHGCIHLAAADLIPLYDWLPVGTLVWIAEH